MRRLLLALVCAGAASAKKPAPKKPTPKPPVFQDNCGTKAEKSHVVGFRAPGGPRLVGIVLGSGKTGVVLTHEIRANLWRWLPFARVLAQNGYRVIAFDARNHGSSGFAGGGAWGMDRDVVAAGRLLVARGAAELFLAGASAGGTASIVAAADLAPKLAGVVTLSGPAQFGGLDASAAAANLAVPSLFVAAAGDAPFTDDARALFAAVHQPDKELEIVPGYSHGTALLLGSSGQSTRARFLALLAKY